MAPNPRICHQRQKSANFAADVYVVISDIHHHPELNVISVGPFLLAKVKPGKYTVAATLAGKTLHKQVMITAGIPKKVEFLWPTGTGETQS